jgi:hypothetical protein
MVGALLLNDAEERELTLPERERLAHAAARLATARDFSHGR